MSHESLSSTQMRTLLQSEYQIIFYPKRALTIPTVTDSALLRIVLPENLGIVKEQIADLTNYVHGEPVGDSFGSDHEARRAWRSHMVRQFGETFEEVYKNHNQFRANIIGLTRLAMYDLSDHIEDRHVSSLIKTKFQAITELLDGTMTGIEYRDIQLPEDKLYIVHYIEDACIEVLQKLSEK